MTVEEVVVPSEGGEPSVPPLIRSSSVGATPMTVRAEGDPSSPLPLPVDCLASQRHQITLWRATVEAQMTWLDTETPPPQASPGAPP